MFNNMISTKIHFCLIFSLQISKNNSVSTQATNVPSHQGQNKFLLRSGLEGLFQLKSVNSTSQLFNPSSPSEIDVDAIYTHWAPWSPCRRRCRQIRKRFCTVPAICGKNVLKVMQKFPNDFPNFQKQAKKIHFLNRFKSFLAKC